MKCQKCGYNSFEFLDACRKCGAELATFKKAHRIVPVILAAVPEAAAAAAAGPQEAPPGAGESSPATTASGEELQVPFPDNDACRDFSLGFPEPAPAGSSDAPFSGFSFDEDAEPVTQKPAPAPSGGISPMIDFSFDGDDAETPPWGAAAADVSDAGSLPDAPIAAGEPAEGLSRRMDDFCFDTEPAAEDPFAAPEPPAATAKKPEFNLENFDREFEMIFADSDSADKDT